MNQRQAFAQSVISSSSPVPAGRGVPLPCLPDVIFHADWGTNPKKRASTTLRLDGPRERYGVDRISPSSRGADVLAALIREADEGRAVFAGFDFGIGLPLAYPRAGLAGHNFVELLANLPASFFKRVPIPELGPHSPFMAGAIPKGHKLSDIVERVGLPEGLRLRSCEEPTAYRRAAECLFSPKPIKQVTGAVRTGWEELLRPALRDHRDRVRLWPFDGDLGDLIQPGTVTIVETYPAEFYAHLGIEGGAKRVFEWRRAAAPHLLNASKRVQLSREVRDEVSRAFGQGTDAEDRFDALVGGLAMARVALGEQFAGAPDHPEVRDWEGWILSRPY